MVTPIHSELSEEPLDIQHTGQRGLVEAELISSVAWLIRLRWIAGGGVIISTWIVGELFNLQVPQVQLYLIGGLILTYNLAFLFVERQYRRDVAVESKYGKLALWQVGMDWAAMSFLFHFSGGIESPVILFFIFHIIIASIFFARKTAFTFAFLAIAIVSAVTLLEYFQVLPHYTIVGLLDTPVYQNSLLIFTILIFFSATCLVTAYLVSSIQERLRQREEEVLILTRHLKRQTLRLQAVNQGARTVNSTLELPEVLNRLAKTTAETVGVHACSIHLLDKSGSQLEPVAQFGLEQKYLNKGLIDPLTNRLAKQALSGQIVNIADVQKSTVLQYQQEAQKEGIQSILSAPLMGKEGPLGILCAYAREPNHFSTEDEQFLTTIAAQGSIAIENAVAYQEIESLDSAKSQFIQIVTHELRSPVSVARSLLRTISAGYVDDVSPKQMDLLNRASRRLEFLQKLIDDLLDLAAGKTDIGAMGMLEPINLEKTIHTVVERFEIPANEKGIELNLIVEEEIESKSVLATPDGLDRIFDNLISNAIKYTPENGKVTVTLTKSDRDAEITVEDTGIGISEDAMQNLFKEFFRAPNAKSMASEGTGLGLTIAKNIITRFNGRVIVQSKLDQGTRFIVTLPLTTTNGGIN